MNISMFVHRFIRRHFLPLFCFQLLYGGILLADPSSENYHVTFEPPKGWLLADQKMLSPNVKALVIGPKTSHFPPSVNLATEKYSGSLKNYLKLVRSISASKGGTWKDLGVIKTTAGTASLSQLDSKGQWGETRMMHVILLKDGMVYIMTAAALKDEFPTYYKQFFNAFSSLKFTEGRD